MSYHRPANYVTMTADDDTPPQGQDCIDWEEIGKDALASLLDHHRMETGDAYWQVIETLREGEEPTEDELRALKESVDGGHSVVEAIVTEHLLEDEPTKW